MNPSPYLRTLRGSMNDRDFMDFIELQFSEEELAQFDDDEQQYYDLLAHEFGLPFDETEQYSEKLSNLE